MTEGTIKTSKYEIIAIFREELRKRTEIEIFFNNTSIITQLTRVDFAEFHIQTKTPNLKFLSHNALLKNAVLMLAEYGEITIDLVVKNVIVITLDNANEESESYYQISCQFKFRHLDDQRRIEKILLDLILEAKRKKRI